MSTNNHKTVKSEAEKSKPKKFSFSKTEIEESDRLRKLSFSVDLDNSDNSEGCLL